MGKDLANSRSERVFLKELAIRLIYTWLITHLQFGHFFECLYWQGYSMSLISGHTFGHAFWIQFTKAFENTFTKFSK